MTSSAAAGHPGNPSRLVHDPRADETGVLTVAHDGHAEALRVVHRETHHARVRHGPTVVGEGDRAGGDHVADLRERTPFLPRRDRADRVHAHRAVADGALHEEADRGTLVRHRLGVRHRAHGREPAMRRGTGARVHGLLVLAPGLAQVRVRVHEARKHDLLRAFDRLALGDLQVLPDLDDPAVTDDHVGDEIEARGRVDDAPSPKQQRHCPHLPTAGT
jgi:hypothetical protein